MKNSGDQPAGENSPQPRAVVAGHGDFPEGMVSAVEQISGRGGVFLPLSNRGLSGQDIETRLKSVADETGVRVFFTDLPAGSATLAIREFVFQSDADSVTAARQSVEKGRASLGAFGPG